MKTSRKDFDCVRMKNEIQRKLMAEQAGMSLEQRQRDMDARIAANPILGPWFRRVKAAQRSPLTVAEDAPPYRAAEQAAAPRHDADDDAGGNEQDESTQPTR